MWIEVTDYKNGEKVLINANKITSIDKFINESGTLITFLISKDTFAIRVKETCEEIKTMLLDSKKEKKEKE